MNKLVPPEELLGALEQLELRAPRPKVPLLQTIENWNRLVDQIGQYPGGIADEYVNDLGSRTLAALWLDWALEDDMTELLEWVLPILDEIDGRYRAKSRTDQEGLNWDSNRLNPNYWWLRRLPVDEGLLTHFRAVGPSMRAH